MLENLSPIRKFAYIFDRRHIGMIGSEIQSHCVTQAVSGDNQTEGKTARGKD